MTRNRIIFISLLFVIVSLPFVYQVTRYYDYINDDAYITFRYSRNLVAGIGPYFNAGEHVEGYTNPLQMFQTALVIRLAGPDGAPGIARFLGVLYAAGCVALTLLLFRGVFPASVRTLSPWLVVAGGFLAAVMVSMAPSFTLNATSGLETSMFAFFLCLGMVLGLREMERARWLGSGIAFALALLARPEGSFLFAVWWMTVAAVFIGGRAGKKRSGARKTVFGGIVRDATARMLVTNALIVSGVFLAHLAFRYLVYDGELLPNTYYAKQGGFWAVPPVTYIAEGLLPPVLGLWGIAVAAIGFAVGAGRFPARMAGVAAVAATGGLLPFFLGTDWMVGGRMTAPFIPAAAVLVTGGWMLLLERVKRFVPAGKKAAATTGMVGGMIGVCVLLWTTQAGWGRLFDGATSIRTIGYRAGHMALAEWLRANAAPGDCVALMDVGIIGYRCIDQTMLDITGLTDRYIAKSPGTFLTKEYDPAYILDRKPRFIVITITGPGKPGTVPAAGTKFTPWTGIELRLVEDPRFQQAYLRKIPAPPEGTGNWLDEFAAIIGAEKIFEHTYPHQYYLLAVYQRQEE